LLVRIVGDRKEVRKIDVLKLKENENKIISKVRNLDFG